MKVDSSKRSPILVLDSERGATSLEVAVSALPFFAIVCGLVGFISWAHTTMTMQYALNQAARWAITGNTLPDPQTGIAMNRSESVRLMFQKQLKAFGQDPADVTLTMCPVTAPNCTSDSVSSAGRHFIIRATKPASEFFGFPALAPSASVVIRNEPYA